MARDITVTFDDGSTHVYRGAPDDATPEAVTARAQKDFGKAVAALDGGRTDTRPEFVKALGNLGAGAIRGAGSIGATLLWPIDKATDLIKGDRGPTMAGMIVGQQPLSRNEERRQSMTGALQSLGFDTDSGAFAAGKIGGEVAGTMGAGGALANALARVPAVVAGAPGLLQALRTGGMATGNAPAGAIAKAADMSTRVAGGAVGGGLSAALANPEDAATGAAIGGALPPVLVGAGKVGRAIGAGIRKVTNPSAAAAAEFEKAMGILTPAERAEVVSKLRAVTESVPGSAPTAAQALQSPQASILERVVSDSPGGAAIKTRYMDQNAARLAALEGVAPTHPAGYAQARADMGNALSGFANKARDAAKAETRAAYEAVPQDDAALYLPDLAAVRDQFFGRGVFGGREAADQAVSTAQKIGTQELSSVAAARGPKDAGRSLAQAVRRAGGIAPSGDAGVGELGGLVVMRRGGLSPAHMAEKMREAGYLRSDDTNELLDALRGELHGRRSVSDFDAGGKAWQAAREAAMGPPPAAEAIPAKVTLREFDNLRKSIGAAQRAAAREPGRAAEAAALSKMKQALDDRINEVVRGDGAADEVLPIAWADALDQARKLKLAEVERFMTGPQAAIFRKGSDGQPLVQGAEVAGKFWGAGLSAPEDVRSFRRLIDDHPQLLGQFRSMVTSEGESTRTAGSALSSKFAKWVETRLPGLREAFTADQVRTLRKIAADIERAEAATAAGASKGSPTYANAANALSLGVLDSKALGAAANIPGLRWVSAPALDMARNSLRTSKAGRLSEALLDPQGLAAALEARNVPATNSILLEALARSSPVLGADLRGRAAGRE